ncbi:uncharacterized protein LOC144658185 isoform X1 [Oculina patagonica]
MQSITRQSPGLMFSQSVWKMSVYCIWIFVLETSNVVPANLATDDCRALQFKLPVNNRKLVGHVIKSILVKSEIGCEANCFKEDNCMSMNLGPLEDGKHVCELSSSDHDLHPEDLKHQEEFIYRPVLNHCSSSPCPPTHRCQTGFTDKGYRCIASEKSTGDTDNKTDVDECATGNHTCHLTADCINTIGSFNCSCRSGYNGTGINCTDIDECTIGSHSCDVFANCSNTDGSYDCSCITGYNGTGYSCTDINECINGNHDCHMNANCINTAGSFNCHCKEGFTGDGRWCSDIDECVNGDHDCHLDGNCINTAGSFNCICQPGYIGDGRLCSENWKKVNTDLVCFGAEGNRHGTLVIGEHGSIYTFKLVHKTGSLTCGEDSAPKSHWGCVHPFFGDKQLLTVITYPNKTALPIAEYTRDNRNCGAFYYSYNIDGMDPNSPELVFNNLSPPLSVSIGQMFHIWYGEDLLDCTEFDNSGETCADVYAWYTTN